DSLLVVIRIIEQTPDTQLPPGTTPGTIFTYSASLIDPITGNLLGSEQQFMSMNLAYDSKEMQAELQGTTFNMNQNGGLRDPDPAPAPAAPAIADVYKIEPNRTSGGALQVEGTYRLINGQLDGTPFEQELSHYPNNFGKFTLPVP